MPIDRFVLARSCQAQKQVDEARVTANAENHWNPAVTLAGRRVIWFKAGAVFLKMFEDRLRPCLC